MHQPSVRVLKLIAEALNVSAETVLMQAGLLGGHEEGDSDGSRITEQVTALIWADNRLSESQKAALLAVYDSMLQK
jgi:transcriptional regulator with XRE-family HTH domain